uniref:CD209 antigen-like n=1 Tax=Epinephelus lanceolatus TaxID=310571 RepID=UPI001447F178|nr:CD209 antigen-like [Epinephelus lanceolatus]
MDELSNIYVNVERPSGNRNQRKRERKSSENIYENVVNIQEPNGSGPSHSGAADVKKSSCRAAAVCLGLLCLLLLTGLTTLVFLFTKSNSEWEMEMFLLQDRNNNLTKERDQLQTSYNNLSKERDQLQTSYNNLSKERDQLQTSHNNLSKERDQLRTSYSSLSKERDQLRTSYSSLSKERDQLRTSYNSLSKERDQLQTSHNNLSKERNQLQKKNEALTKDRNDLQRKLEARWMYFRGSFYHISSDQKTWQESRRDCQQKDADLVIINSKEEQDFTRQFKKYMWIGLTDLQTEGTWKWVDGTQVTKSYWGPKEPNGGSGENCGEMKFDSENSWNDGSCSLSHFWMCEKKVRP